jgi:thiamine-phosphate pyrophosphorylase
VARLPRLLVVTDWGLPRERLLAALDAALAAGPEVEVQHRHPGAPTRVFLEEARVLVARYGAARVWVNGRPDVAALLGASLHLPAGGLLAREVRGLLAPGARVSVAVHDAREAAEAEGADVALVSPVFAPGSKPGDARPQLGPEGFARLAALLPCPALALGGMMPARLGALPGAAGAAAISAVLSARAPGDAARAFLAALPR